MVFLYIDVESIPTKNEAVIKQIREGIKPPGNISKPETIAKWHEENFEAEFDKAFRKTALDGLYGEILSIAWAFGDEEPGVIIRKDGSSEKDLLEAFFTWISTRLDIYGQRTAITKWIGHYISGFDLRFIWQRCVINGVRPLIEIPYDAKPWDDNIFDTYIAWTGGSSRYSGAGSLGALSPVFGLHKGDMDGSQVYDYYLAGRLDEIASYNKKDVEDCRTLHKRMTFQ